MPRPSMIPSLKASVLLTHLCLELVMNFTRPSSMFAFVISVGNDLISLWAKCLWSERPLSTSRPSMSSLYHIFQLWSSLTQLRSAWLCTSLENWIIFLMFPEVGYRVPCLMMVLRWTALHSGDGGFTQDSLMAKISDMRWGFTSS